MGKRLPDEPAGTVATELDTPLSEMTGPELAEKVESGEVSIAELMDVEGLRRRITRYVVERDVEEHRDVYERLAET